jgi:RNA recognition motif-containing protein
MNINIYVGNLSPDVTKEELRREFMAFGEVISVVIMNDKYIGSGQTRGYGFVEMPSVSEAEAAIASLNGKRLRGRVIDVVQALPLSDRKGHRAGCESGMGGNRVAGRIGRRDRRGGIVGRQAGGLFEIGAGLGGPELLQRQRFGRPHEFQ